jgi:hypothetical protein
VAPLRRAEITGQAESLTGQPGRPTAGAKQQSVGPTG